MKLIRLQQWGTGIVVDDPGSDAIIVNLSAVLSRGGCADVSDAAGPRLHSAIANGDWTQLISDWPTLQPALAQIARGYHADPQRYDDAAIPYVDVVERFAPLVNSGVRLFAAGANFADHAAHALTTLTGSEVTPTSLLQERVDGLPPWGFPIVPGTVVGDGAFVVPPSGVQKLDYEAEIGAVLAVGGRNLTVDEMGFWAFTPFCDFSIRDPFLGIGKPIDRGALTWGLVKNWDTGNLIGPWLTTLDEGYELDDIDVELRVNGELRQSINTSGMTYSFAEIASHISRFIELRPGDMVFSGTGLGTAVESGVEGEYLQDGDEIALSVEGAGVLRSTISKGVSTLSAADCGDS